MNKYWIILIILIVSVGLGIAYNFFIAPHLGCPKNPVLRQITMQILQNQWKFEPNFLEISRCEKVILDIYNEDSYDHGLAIDSFGINRRLSPKTTTTIEFIASQTGEFNFYCSVPCGEGHYNQTGKIIVR